MWSQFLGPFDQRDAIHSFLQAEFEDLGRILDPVEVEMPDVEPVGLVSLDQCVGRTRYLGVGAGQFLNQSARKCGFTHAQIALQRDHIARLAGGGEPATERHGRGLVGQGDGCEGCGHQTRICTAKGGFGKAACCNEIAAATNCSDGTNVLTNLLKRRTQDAPGGNLRVNKTEQRIVILGAGQAGAQTAVSLRQLGHTGEIVLVGEEPDAPYQRPPLSKGYLKGELERERLYLKGDDYYAEHGVKLMLGVRAETIDAAANRVTLSTGEQLDWDSLVIATGARARKLSAPGSDLPEVLELRTLADIDLLKPHARKGVSVLVIGAGYIGLEAAAALTQMGVSVRILEAAPQVLGRVAGPEIGAFFLDKHRASGVELMLNAKLDSFIGEGGKLTGARLADGETIACDVALVGIGVVPNMEIAQAAGIACGNGVIVDERARTDHPDIYAIGDVALRPLTHYRREGRLESVHNAIEGGKIAAAAILDAPPPPIDVPWFWSDQYDVKLQTAGIWAGADASIVRGDPESGSFSVFYLKAGAVIAVDAVNAPPDFIVGKKLVAAAVSVAPTELSDTSLSMKDIGAKALRPN